MQNIKAKIANQANTYFMFYTHENENKILSQQDSSQLWRMKRTHVFFVHKEKSMTCDNDNFQPVIEVNLILQSSRVKFQ